MYTFNYATISNFRFVTLINHLSLRCFNIWIISFNLSCSNAYCHSFIDHPTKAFDMIELYHKSKLRILYAPFISS